MHRETEGYLRMLEYRSKMDLSSVKTSELIVVFDWANQSDISQLKQALA